MNYLLWLQGRREHSRAELRKKLDQKLREKGLVDQHDPEVLLDRLAELGLQSDRRFLEGQVRQATTGGRGPAWVRHRLSGHKLLAEEVAVALADVDPEQWDREAFALARRRFGQGPYDHPQRMKVGNFLIRRGYSIDQARRISCQEWPEEERLDIQDE